MFCGGRRDDCPECAGTNRIPVHRCPQKLVTRRELDVLTAAALVEHGVLPDPGGWQDQPHTFVQAYPIAMGEIQHWRGVHQRLAMQEAKKQK